MRIRFGIVAVGMLSLTAAGCASGGGGGGGGTTAARPAAAPAGGARGSQAFPAGEEPIQNGNTRTADTQLGLAMAKGGGDAAAAEYQRALQAAQAAITQDARNPLPFMQAGRAYAGLGQYAAADSMFDKAVELRPAYTPEADTYRETAWIAIYNKAAPMIQAAQYTQALPVIESASMIYDKRPEMRIIAGQIYLQENQPDKAIDHLKRAQEIIRTETSDSATMVSWKESEKEIPPALAQAYLLAKRYPEAVGAIKPLWDAEPTNLNYARTLASIYAQLGQGDSARAVFQKMESVPGANLTADDYYVIGLGYQDMSAFGDAARALTKVMQLAPKQRDAAEWLARSYTEQLRDAGATPDATLRQNFFAAVDKWIELDPYAGIAYLFAAGEQQKAGNTARAAELAGKADGLKVNTDRLEMRKREGGVTVLGDLINKKATAGGNANFTFTFYGANGQAIGTQTVAVRIAAVDATTPFEVSFNTTQPVMGYTYTLVVP
jgi:tetratricopeptide (TPR) repeat protein